MNEVLNQSYKLMHKRYRDMLNDFYPARGSTGFTESNQVHIFINSLIKSLNDDTAIEWLEFPWIDKKQHIDGMVYSPKYKTIFYIEAKRFSHKTKIKSIESDIIRIILPMKNDQSIERSSFLNEHHIGSIKNEFIIILADVWKETTWKEKIPKQWEENNLFSHLNHEIQWNEAITYIKTFEDNERIQNYCLLMAHKKI